ncbi:hypothetical protein M569_10515, partial [Genlisea aurea]
REKEETDLKAPETRSRCSPLPISSHPHIAVSRSMDIPDLDVSGGSETRISSASSAEKPDLESLVEKHAGSKRPREEATRCSGSGCRKRVGLIGFRCRCGDLFCSEHRYSDRHDCNYDYKKAGREAISKENPVIKACKLVKI